MVMKIKAVQTEKLEEGKYIGVIIGIEHRTEPHEYVDVLIETKGIKLKAGYPNYLSETSGLGKLLTRMGYTVKAGIEYDIEELVGRTVSFMVADETITTEGKYKGKVFSKVMVDTVKSVDPVSASLYNVNDSFVNVSNSMPKI